jgi:hypothetical protein
MGLKVASITVQIDCGGGTVLGAYFRGGPAAPIKNGKFTLRTTKEQTVLDGARHAIEHYVITGTFKSPTKFVGKKSVKGTIETHFPGQPAETADCSGEQSLVATYGK